MAPYAVRTQPGSGLVSTIWPLRPFFAPYGINQGNSCIVDPMGKVLVGPVKGTQEILYADLELDLIPAAKRMFDSAGHYARPEVFSFGVNRGG